MVLGVPILKHFRVILQESIIVFQGDEKSSLLWFQFINTSKCFRPINFIFLIIFDKQRLQFNIIYPIWKAFYWKVF